MTKVKINRTVYNNSKFKNIVETDFSEFSINNVPKVEFIPSIEQFFKYYSELFYQIPKEGDTNSHRYLISQSTEYAGIVEDEGIQALLDEITFLREQNLGLQQAIIESQTK